MPVCALTNNEGFLYASTADVSTCAGYVMVSVEEYNFLMDYTQVTALEIATHFSGGFSLVFVFGYLLTLGIKAGKQIIDLM